MSKFSSANSIHRNSLLIILHFKCRNLIPSASVHWNSLPIIISWSKFIFETSVHRSLLINSASRMSKFSFALPIIGVLFINSAS